MRKYTFEIVGGDPIDAHTVVISPRATYYRLLSSTTNPAPWESAGRISINGGTPQDIQLNEGASQVASFSRLGFTSDDSGTFVVVVGIGEELRTENVVVTQAVAPPPPVSFNTWDGSVPSLGWLGIAQRLLLLPFPTQRVSVDLCTLAPGLLVVQDGTATQGIPLPAGFIYRIPSVNGSYIDLYLYNPTAAAITVGWLMLFDML